MKQISNSEIARILREIGIYLEMDEVPFKPQAYEKAAETIEACSHDVQEIYVNGGVKALKEIPGVGQAIAEKIEELVTTGRLRYYEGLRKKIPVKLHELLGIEGLGPQTIKKLYKKLGVRSRADLERAAHARRIRKLPGFGEKSEAKILAGIGFVTTSGGRLPIFKAMPIVRRLEEALRAHPEVERIAVAGSVRRRKEMIGDVDMLAVSRKPAAVMDTLVHLSGVAQVIARGPTKSSVKLRGGLNVDLRVVPAGSYGAALMYFIGSKEHNVALREIAIKKGYKLNEYGLYKGKRIVAGRTEEGIYRALGLDYIEPEMREDRGEIEFARRRALPKLIGYGDLKGDLQMHTNWSDGKRSIEDMARAAVQVGLEYIAITDHTTYVTITNGLDEKRLTKQWAEIDRVNKLLRGKIKVLKGIECDIRRDGSLDLPDRVLQKLDLVGIAVHYHTKLTSKEQTARVVRAMENRHADILFHPTGRIVGRRPSYDIDIRELVRTAKRTGTVLEVDSNERLDLNENHVRECVSAGVKIAVDSDAHREEDFSLLEYGTMQARRGWAERGDVINAWPLEKMKNFLKR